MLTSKALWVSQFLVLAFVTACGGATSGTAGQTGIGRSRDAVTAGKCPAGATVLGIDVSEFQGSVNWAAVHGAGVQFAIARTNDGAHVDPYFDANWAGMKAAGLIRGAYQFFEPANDPTAQANMVIDKVGRLGPGDMPVMLDVEVTNGLGGADITARIHTWVDAITAGTGKQPFIYSGAYFWDGNVGSADFASLALDVAWYGTNCPGTPNAWANWTFHQYTDALSISGVSGGVDADVFNGDLAALQAWAGAGDPCQGLADGTYCGNTHGMTGDPSTLYACSTGKQATVATCNLCESTPGGDFCLEPKRMAGTADPNGDGKADFCARDSAGYSCWPASSTGFASPFAGPLLSDASGWGEPKYFTTFLTGDINGDGKADLCARGAAGVGCWLSTGTSFSAQLAGPPLSDANGWGLPQFYSTIQMADVNGDGNADICGRAIAGYGCWLSDGKGGFATQIPGPPLSDAEGWAVPLYYSSIQLADVNGDGKADICARGWAGVSCWLSNGTGFPTLITGPALSDPSGWAFPQYSTTLQMADVNGDGKADICARAAAGFSCWLSDGKGFPTAIAGPPLSDAMGWAKPEYYTTIQMADVNGDGKADVCGRGNAGVSCWLSNGSGFPTAITGPALSDASGWAAPQYYTSIQMADINGDGKADLCARGGAGIFCWLSTGTGFSSTGVQGPALSDAAGWAHPRYFETLKLIGGGMRPAAVKVPSADGGVPPVTTPPSHTGPDGGIGGVTGATGTPSGTANLAQVQGCSVSSFGAGRLDVLGCLLVLVGLTLRPRRRTSR